ncbi:hypothetical protein GCM10027046_08640 [Uliginosibacterium flavum]
MIIAFHGNGQTGTGSAADIGKVDDDGLARQIALSKWDPSYRFIVLSPQMNTQTRTAQAVHDFIQFAKANYKIDTSRIYLTGLSGGGGPLYAYLDAYAGGEAAAVIPVAAIYSFAGLQCGWKNIPVWFFHGALDPTVVPNHSKQAFDGLKACTPAPAVAPRFTIYTNVAHSSWARTYDLSGMTSTLETMIGTDVLNPYDQSIYDWLLQYHR